MVFVDKKTSTSERNGRCKLCSSGPGAQYSDATSRMVAIDFRTVFLMVLLYNQGVIILELGSFFVPPNSG